MPILQNQMAYLQNPICINHKPQDIVYSTFLTYAQYEYIIVFMDNKPLFTCHKSKVKDYSDYFISAITHCYEITGANKLSQITKIIDKYNASVEAAKQRVIQRKIDEQLIAEYNKSWIKHKPVVRNVEPVVRNVEPVVPNAEPVVHNAEPVVHNVEPVTDSKRRRTE